MTVHGKNGEIEMSPSYLRRKGAFFSPNELMIREGNRSIIGEVIGHRGGHGFVVTRSNKRLYLPPPDMSRVLHGDLVKVLIAYDAHNDKEYAKLIEILSRKQKTILGAYHRDKTGYCVIPINSRLQRFIYLDKPVKGIQHNDVVEVKVLSRRNHELPRVLHGEFVRHLPYKNDARLETDIAINDFALSSVFSPEACAEAEKLPTEILPEDFPARPYLVDLPFVTIDGEDAKDFDDAVFCRAEDKSYRLWVAIADVSHYVCLGSALDMTATQRATSAYFPDRVIPMLPEKLSNELCSLKPDCDRLVMVCELLINQTGKREEVKYYPAIIRSQARLIYEEVDLLVQQNKEPPNKKLSAGIKKSLETLKQLTEILLAVKKERKALNFSGIAEVKPIINEKGEVEDLVIQQRTFAHQMIEEAMLIANSTTAWFLSKKGIPFLYRVHKEPEHEAVEALRHFLHAYGIDFPTTLRGRVDAPIYSHLIHKVNQLPEGKYLEGRILQSLTRAEYARKNYGHFGLNYKSYTHFTSPIRRYADICVHRALKKIVIRDEKSRAQYSPTAGEVNHIAFLCSKQAKTVEQAGWQVLDGLKCRYLKKHKRSHYEGRVVSVVDFGFFVRLKDHPIDGLVHLSNLKDDFYRYNSAAQRFIGSRTGQEYKVGDKITVRVLRINMQERKIDMIVA